MNMGFKPIRRNFGNRMRCSTFGVEKWKWLRARSEQILWLNTVWKILLRGCLRREMCVWQASGKQNGLSWKERNIFTKFSPWSRHCAVLPACHHDNSSLCNPIPGMQVRQVRLRRLRRATVPPKEYYYYYYSPLFRNILSILSIHSFAFSLILFVFSFSWSGVATLKVLMVQGKGLVSHRCPAHLAILTAHSTNIFSFPFSKPVSHETVVRRLLAQFFLRFVRVRSFSLLLILNFGNRSRNPLIPWACQVALVVVVLICGSSAEPFRQFVYVESLLLWRGACWNSQGDLVIMRVKRDKDFFFRGDLAQRFRQKISFRKCFTKTGGNFKIETYRAEQKPWHASPLCFAATTFWLVNLTPCLVNVECLPILCDLIASQLPLEIVH